MRYKIDLLGANVSILFEIIDRNGKKGIILHGTDRIFCGMPVVGCLSVR